MCRASRLLSRTYGMRSIASLMLLLFVIDPRALAQELRSEAFSAIMKTMQWAEKIKSYDLEIVAQRTQAVGDSETTFSTARIVREICFDSSRFLINDTQGMWYLSLVNKGQSDSMKVSYRVGDAKSAKAWTKGFGEATINCRGGNCLESARVHRWKILPLCFVLPLEQGAEEKQFEECVELLLNEKRSKVISAEKMEMTHFGERKKIRDFKVVFDLSAPTSVTHDYIGIELIVSDEGDDDEYVLGWKWYNVKENIEDLLNASNIVNLDRSVSCKWQKQRFQADEFVVPTIVKQKYNPLAGKDSLSQSTTYVWKQGEEALKELTLNEFEEVVKDSERRVNKLLNR